MSVVDQLRAHFNGEEFANRLAIAERAKCLADHRTSMLQLRAKQRDTQTTVSGNTTANTNNTPPVDDTDDEYEAARNEIYSVLIPGYNNDTAVNLIYLAALVFGCEYTNTQLVDIMMEGHWGINTPVATAPTPNHKYDGQDDQSAELASFVEDAKPTLKFFDIDNVIFIAYHAKTKPDDAGVFSEACRLVRAANLL